MTGTEILIFLLGGIALLLWGCRMVRTGMMRAFGSMLTHVVGTWVDNRLRAVAVGTVVGTALQSSTATVLLVNPFIAQGAIYTSGALALMLGADLGSAIAALVFSSGISAAWPVFAFVGYVFHVSAANRNVRVKHIGRILIGLGLLFLGLRTIGTTASGLSDSPVIFSVIEAVADDPPLAILSGAFLTWLSYSSVAVVLFTAALASASGFSAELFFPLILGVNLGAALPALSSTLAEIPAFRRVPIGNLIFRTVGVTIVAFAIEPVSLFIERLSETAAMQIIAFHACFNAALIPAFIGLTGPVSWLVRKWFPDLMAPDRGASPRHLDPSLQQMPSTALGAAARETLKMGEIIEDMLAKTIEIFETGKPDLIDSVESSEDQLDTLNDSIKLYLTRLMRQELNDEEIQRAIEIVTFTTNLDHVGDIIDRNLLELANKKTRLKVQFSAQGLAELHGMHTRIMDTLNLSLNVFISGQPDSARALVLRKAELRALELEGTEKHLDRLRAGKFESIVTSSIHLDVIRDFKRINSHLVSVAYPVLERAGELRTSRLTKKALKSIHPKSEPGSGT